MKRKFNFKPVVMLASAGVVSENFENNKSAFVKECPHWGDGFSTDLKESINAGYNRLGIKSHSQLKEATIAVKKIQENALSDLSMVKTQIERSFKDDRPRMKFLLDQLGFTALWKKVRSQTVLIELLFTFQNNLSQAIKEELIAKGVNAARMDALIFYANELNKANVNQETLKGSTKMITESFYSELNSIYDRAMDICKIGHQIFRKDAVRKDMFNFKKIVKAQIAAGIGGGEETEGTASEGA